MNRKVFLICSLLLFILACAFPALEFRRNENGVEVWGGLQILCTGWIGLFMGQFAWFANLLILAAAVQLWRRHRVPCVICASLALLLSLDTLLLFGAIVPGDEGGVSKLFLQRLLAGTYLWESSIVILLLGGLLFRETPRAEFILDPDQAFER